MKCEKTRRESEKVETWIGALDGMGEKETRWGERNGSFEYLPAACTAASGAAVQQQIVACTHLGP